MSSSEKIRIRVLVIAMANSIHTARWLSQFKHDDVDIVLFPSTPSRTLHPTIADLLCNDSHMTLEIAPLMKRMAYPLGILDLFLSNFLRSILLRRLISGRNRFEVIHSLELQHAGYLLNKVSSVIPKPTRVIVSNWGSDIFWFQRFPRHRRKLERLLRIATHYSCECKRDIALAGNLGFSGTSFPVHPNAGAYPAEVFLAAQDAPSPSSRRIVMLKGYTGFVGRADIALEACRLASERLRSYKLILYSSDFRSRRIARRISKENGLDITVFRKHELSHERMLEFFRNSRAYVGISESDGISTSLLDSISSGCYPIQTNTSCADEWITNGLTGSIVDFNNIYEIASAIDTALSDDNLVDEAARLNIRVAQTRLSSDALSKDLKQFYGLA